MIVDLYNLPDEVLFYSNDQFFKFIEDCLGVDEMILLKLQSIKSIRTLLNVPDVFAVLHLSCKELIDLKHAICFIDEENDRNVVVKAGIKAGVDNLIKILKEKNQKFIKRKQNIKSLPSSSSTINDQSVTSPLSNTSISDSVNSSLTSTPATTVNLMPINDYINAISNSIEKFSINNFKNFILKHNDDYVICLNLLNTDIKGHIKCGCNTIVKLVFRRNSNAFQLSAYFKHIKKSNCSMIKKRKRLLLNGSKEKDDSLNNLSQNNNFFDMNDGSDCEEEILNEDHDTSQVTINTSISNNSNTFNKRRSTSCTNIAKKKRRK